MASDLLFLAILIFLSGFFSATEIALITSNKIKIEVKARRNNLAAKIVRFFINEPRQFFSAILIGNNIVNLTFASVSTVFLYSLYGFSEFTILIISSSIILFFGEILPKYFARELSDRMILLAAIPLRIFSFILYPFVKTASSVSSFLLQSSNLKAEGINYLFSREDIELLVKESHEAGIVDKKESNIISRIFALGEQRVYETMRPRTEIIGISTEQSINEALELFIESGYSKLLLYEENLDNIKGVIHATDLFKFPENIQSIVREIFFVPETKKTFELLNEFLNKNISIAIVIDEFGGTAGLITMEDIIEEIFGEIKDEYDIEENICRNIGDNAYLISGKVEIDYINETFNLDIPVGDYETIGGYISSRLGRIPEQGENVITDSFNIFIARADRTRIDLVRLIDNREVTQRLLSKR